MATGGVQINQYQRALDRLQGQINALIDRVTRVETTAGRGSATGGTTTVVSGTLNA